MGKTNLEIRNDGDYDITRGGGLYTLRDNSLTKTTRKARHATGLLSLGTMLVLLTGATCLAYGYADETGQLPEMDTEAQAVPPRDPFDHKRFLGSKGAENKGGPWPSLENSLDHEHFLGSKGTKSKEGSRSSILPTADDCETLIPNSQALSENNYIGFVEMGGSKIPIAKFEASVPCDEWLTTEAEPPDASLAFLASLNGITCSELWAAAVSYQGEESVGFEILAISCELARSISITSSACSIRRRLQIGQFVLASLSSAASIAADIAQATFPAIEALPTLFSKIEENFVCDEENAFCNRNGELLDGCNVYCAVWLQYAELRRLVTEGIALTDVSIAVIDTILSPLPGFDVITGAASTLSSFIGFGATELTIESDLLCNQCRLVSTLNENCVNWDPDAQRLVLPSLVPSQAPSTTPTLSLRPTGVQTSRWTCDLAIVPCDFNDCVPCVNSNGVAAFDCLILGDQRSGCFISGCERC